MVIYHSYLFFDKEYGLLTIFMKYKTIYLFNHPESIVGISTVLHDVWTEYHGLTFLDTNSDEETRIRCRRKSMLMSAKFEGVFYELPVEDPGRVQRIYDFSLMFKEPNSFYIAKNESQISYENFINNTEFVIFSRNNIQYIFPRLIL